jgi:hypothetical protein
MKLRPTKNYGPFGAGGRMLGLCIQAPELKDRNGLRFWEAKPQAWAQLPKTFLRHPNGTAIYDIESSDDARFNMVKSELFGTLPNEVKQDICFPPQLPAGTVAAWATPRTARIVYGNEPPMHIPDIWESGIAYAEGYKTFYDSLPNSFKENVWFQSGKEEILNFAQGLPDRLIQKHFSVKSAMIECVSEGYPARVATTHKLRPDYPGNAYWFYRALLNMYRDAYGHKVKLLFHEYKLDDGVTDTEDAVLLLAQFLIVMSRLIYESDTIDGGAYQQGAGTGTVNLIGRNENQEWVTTWLTQLWIEFGHVLINAKFIETEQIERPDYVSIEAYEFRSGTKYLLFCNRGSDEYINLPGKSVTLFSNREMKKTNWNNVLPAKSCGVIKL